MKEIGRYFLMGCVAAIVGMFFSDICGDFFNGMDYGSACVLGMGMFLCVVVITCTGIIVSKIGSKPNEENTGEKEDQPDSGFLN